MCFSNIHLLNFITLYSYWKYIVQYDFCFDWFPPNIRLFVRTGVVSWGVTAQQEYLANFILKTKTFFSFYSTVTSWLMTLTHNDRPSVTAAVCQDEHYTEGETKTFLSFFTVSKNIAVSWLHTSAVAAVFASIRLCRNGPIFLSLGGKSQQSVEILNLLLQQKWFYIYLYIFFPQNTTTFLLIPPLRFFSPPCSALESCSDVSLPGSSEGQQPRRVHTKFTRIY